MIVYNNIKLGKLLNIRQLAIANGTCRIELAPGEVCTQEEQARVYKYLSDEGFLDQPAYEFLEQKFPH